ncbi:MAG: hypothetical protein KAS32_05950 [Candidatus Peribacteraceae bacterium]|nr:hypothetical protein [Candidatus Peribacteraceae bacterium]
MNKLIIRFGEVINSDRFWYAVGIGLLTWAQTGDWKNGLIVTLGTVLGVGTVDKFGKNIGGNVK